LNKEVLKRDLGGGDTEELDEEVAVAGGEDKPRKVYISN